MSASMQRKPFTPCAWKMGHTTTDGSCYALQFFLVCYPGENCSGLGNLIHTLSRRYIDLPNDSNASLWLKIRDTFEEICDIHYVEWQKSRAQNYSVLDLREMYYGPLRLIF